MKILHIAEPQTFTKPFFSLVEKNFEVEDHAILTRGTSNGWPSELNIANKTLSGFFWAFTFLKSAREAEKIVLHGLWDLRPVVLLALYPSLLKKCYWIIWGGDLYHYKFRKHNIKNDTYEAIRAFVIKRIGHFVTYIKGDYELAQQWYGATGQYHECLMYMSNIYKELVIPPKTGTATNILVGNSADPTNNHLDVFEKLLAYKNENLMIYCPLSYGGIGGGYAKQIAEKGAAMFGDRFVALTDFMPFAEYLKFLGQIDIAVFAHKRQQAMGNTITLLGLGKKVYMRSDVTPWALFTGLGLQTFDFMEIDTTLYDTVNSTKNNLIISGYFSEKNLINQYANIFGKSL